jgi:hypothetical protein
LLSVKSVHELDHWNCLEIGNYRLYTHPDLVVTTRKQQSRSIILLGNIFDPYNPLRTNEKVISEVIQSSKNFGDVIIAIKPYFGRYVIIYKDDTTFNIMHDALGQKEIYYCQKPNKVICGSQPNFLNEYSSPKLGYTRDQAVLKFYENELKQNRFGRLWVGDETYFQDIKHLMPNHYLNVHSMSVERYWPNKRLNKINLDVASATLCDFLSGAMKAVTARYEAMVAVTAGFDSRSLLAASKDIMDKVYFFVNQEPRYSERNIDLVISSKMFEKLKQPFNVHKVSSIVDEEFKEIYLKNVFLSTDFILPANYNVYFKNHQKKVNLDGTGEIGREYFGEVPKDVDGYFLARCMKFRNSPYVVAQCDKWLNEVLDVAVKNNVDLLKLLFWEFVMGNWGALAHSEAEISIENFDIYDSHHVCEIMLSVGSVRDDLFKKIIRQMWPELLEFPFNPPDTLKDWMKNLLHKIGFFRYFQRILYKYDRRRFYKYTRKAL